MLPPNNMVLSADHTMLSADEMMLSDNMLSVIFENFTHSLRTLILKHVAFI
jgi:hypothetical protein